MWLFFLPGGLILLALFIGNIYLIQQLSGWWLLLLIPVLSFILVYVILLALTRFIVGNLNPPQSVDQREAVDHFIGKLDKAAETLQTPRFLVFIYLVRDAFMGSQRGFIQQVTNESKSLKSEFERLITLFRPL